MGWNRASKFCLFVLMVWPAFSSLGQDGHSGAGTSKLGATPKSTEEEIVLEDLFLFHPTRHPEGNWKPTGLKFEDVWIDSSNNTRVHGWYCPCDKPRAIVLFAHGNAGNLSDRAEWMTYLQTRLKVTSLIFDYRGYGKSSGRATIRGSIDDARAAAAYLAKREGVPPSELVLMGRSLGGAVLIQLAPELKTRGLVVQSTFSSLKEIAGVHFPHLAWAADRRKLNSRDNLSGYKGPFLQAHGTRDQVVPLDNAKRLFEAANEPKQFVAMQGLGHNDSFSQTYLNALDQFIDQLPETREKPPSP